MRGDFEWARNREVVSVQELENQRLLATTNGGIFYITNGQTTKLVPNVFKERLRDLVVAAAKFGDTLLICTFKSGIFAYSACTEEELWRITPDKIGGALYSVHISTEGIIIGSSAGIYLLPNPQNTEFVKLPLGDPQFAATYSTGSIIGLTSGVYQYPSFMTARCAACLS
jgi:hypothetical protein